MLAELNLYKNYISLLLKNKVEILTDEQVCAYFNTVVDTVENSLRKFEIECLQEEKATSEKIKDKEKKIDNVLKLINWELWPIEGIKTNSLIQKIASELGNNPRKTNSKFVSMGDTGYWKKCGPDYYTFSVNPIYIYKIMQGDKEVIKFLNDLQEIYGHDLSIKDIDEKLSEKFGFETAWRISYLNKGEEYYQQYLKIISMFKELCIKKFGKISYFEKIPFYDREELTKVEKELKDEIRSLKIHQKSADTVNKQYASFQREMLSKLKGLSIAEKRKYLAERYCDQVSSKQFISDIELISLLEKHLGKNSNPKWILRELLEQMKQNKETINALQTLNMDEFINQNIVEFIQAYNDCKTNVDKINENISDIDKKIQKLEQEQKMDIEPIVYSSKKRQLFEFYEFKRKRSIKKLSKWEKRKENRKNEIDNLNREKEKQYEKLRKPEYELSYNNRSLIYCVLNYFEKNCGLKLNLTEEQKNQISLSLESKEKFKSDVYNLIAFITKKLSKISKSSIPSEYTSLFSTVIFNNDDYIKTDNITTVIDILTTFTEQCERVDMSLSYVPKSTLDFAKELYSSRGKIPQENIEELIQSAALNDAESITTRKSARK